MIQELAKRWSTLDITVQEGISQLTTLCVHQLSVNDQKVTNCVTIPNETVAKLFEHASIGLPRITEQEEAKISTKTKLTPRKIKFNQIVRLKVLVCLGGNIRFN